MMNGKKQWNYFLKILKEIDANQKTYSLLKMFENETKVISENNSNNLSVKEIQKGRKGVLPTEEKGYKKETP